MPLKKNCQRLIAAARGEQDPRHPACEKTALEKSFSSEIPCVSSFAFTNEGLVLLRHRQTQLTLPSPGEEWQTDPESLCPKRISDLLKCTELDS